MNRAMKRILKLIAGQLPPIAGLLKERDLLIEENGQLKAELNELNKFAPIGHFYSPVPSLDEVRKNEKTIFGTIPRTLPGIDLNEEEQIRLFNEFKKYYKDLPFPSHKADNLRYFFENGYYSYSDAICLYSMIRYLEPKKIIEVGSGYSSCVILDTNELFFRNSIQCAFIDPFPQSLLSLIDEGDKERLTIIPRKLQDVEFGEFITLHENDILFVDSTHVSKVNSDVNHLLFQILPRLRRGVYIHFHDIHYPFEYPKEWIYEGRAWNEAYILRAFLQYNKSFKIVFFNTFLEHFHEDRFKKEMPLCMKNKGGSIWIKKC